MTTYYVDRTGGNDGWVGTSPETAWKTISKISGFGFVAGDVCLLKRDEVWRETWNVNTGGAAGNPIDYSAYGTGQKPKITGCDLLTGWALHAGNIYVANYVEPIDTYILLEDGEHLIRVANLGAVNSAGKFFPDNANNLIYAWCTDGADPDTHIMEIGSRYDTVNCDDRQYINFQNLHFHGAGGQYGRAFGLKPTWSTPQNITLTECEISHSAYNGVQLTHVDTWNAIDTFEMINCSIHDNQDTGVWIIGENTVRRITNFRMDTCVVYNNGLTTAASMGVFINFCDSPVVTNCTIYDNDGNLDWSDNLLFGGSNDIIVTYNIIHGGNHSGLHLDVNSYGLIHYNLLYECFWNGIWIEEHQTGGGAVTTIYHNTCYHNRHGLVFGPGSTIREVSGVTCKNNIFAYNRRANVELNEDGVAPDYLNNDLDYNCYQTDPTPDPLYEGEFRAESPRVNKTFVQWKTYTSWDVHSKNTNPKFLDPDNQIFYIWNDSLCLNSGILIPGISQEVKGYLPDMGHYEMDVQHSLANFMN